MDIEILQGDCREVIAARIPDCSIDAVVTDPPYHLTSIVKRFGSATASPAKHGTDGVFSRSSAGFMGKQWDGGDVAFQPETWRIIYDAMKPGAHLAAFGGTRTFHRMACAIEDAGFEIRDTICWLYGTGFPKSHDVSKGIDKMLGVKGDFVPEGEPVKRMIPGADQNETGSWIKDNDREYQPGEYKPGSPEAAKWKGFGTSLKPAYEPIIIARKPLDGTVAANTLKYGVGGINVDACRVEGTKDTPASPRRAAQHATYGDLSNDPGTGSGWDPNVGRWPANVVHDGSDEVMAAFPNAPGQQGRALNSGVEQNNNVYGALNHVTHSPEPRGDDGSAARFYYCAKATKADRAGSKHPTVKPISLMRWVCRLITPPRGTILDPFAGSGTTGQAAKEEGFNCILIEREDEYIRDISNRFLEDMMA